MLYSPNFEMAVKNKSALHLWNILYRKGKFNNIFFWQTNQIPKGKSKVQLNAEYFVILKHIQVHLNKLECRGKVISVIKLKLWNLCIK